jgi:hypothetical protein
LDASGLQKIPKNYRFPLVPDLANFPLIPYYFLLLPKVKLLKATQEGKRPSAQQTG